MDANPENYVCSQARATAKPCPARSRDGIQSGLFRNSTVVLSQRRRELCRDPSNGLSLDLERCYSPVHNRTMMHLPLNNVESSSR